MSADGGSLFQQDFRSSQLDCKLRELAARYHEEAEAFDRTVCTGPFIDGSIQPMTQTETAKVSGNALELFRRLKHEAILLGATGDEVYRIVRKVGS